MPEDKSAAKSAKVALVTGGTSGIGKAAAIGLARQGYAVTLLARDATRGATAKADIETAVPGADVSLLAGDLSDQGSVRAAVAAFGKRSKALDVLVHSAGVFLPDRQVTKDGVELTFATNYLGQYQMTRLLQPQLERAHGRVVVVASKYGGAKVDFDDINFDKRPFSYLKAVPASKLSQVLFTQEFAARQNGSGVTINAVHPGLVANTKLLEQTGGFFRWLTNLMGGTPEKGADTVVWLATSPDVAGKSGLLWTKRKPIKTPGQGSDAAVRKRLWELSATMTRMDP